MRRSTFALICTVILFSPGLAFAVSEIGPIHTSNNQTEVCMAKCNFGNPLRGNDLYCNFEIKWLNKNGAVLQSQIFYNVPDQGSRELAYTGSKKLISCRVDPPGPGDRNVRFGGGEELSIAFLDNRGNTVAMMTNDRAEDMPMARCNPCSEVCIDCATQPARLPVDPCDECLSCLEN